MSGKMPKTRIEKRDTSPGHFALLYRVPSVPPKCPGRMPAETGLIWLLQGRAVAAPTAMTAAVKTRSGGTLTYYRLNKAALGPVGDHLDDFSPRGP